MTVIDLAEYRAKRRPPPTEWAQFKTMCDQYDALRVPPAPRERLVGGWLVFGLFTILFTAILWIMWR